MRRNFNLTLCCFTNTLSCQTLFSDSTISLITIFFVWPGRIEGPNNYHLYQLAINEEKSKQKKNKNRKFLTTDTSHIYYVGVKNQSRNKSHLSVAHLLQSIVHRL